MGINRNNFEYHYIFLYFVILFRIYLPKKFVFLPFRKNLITNEKNNKGNLYQLV